MNRYMVMSILDKLWNIFGDRLSFKVDATRDSEVIDILDSIEPRKVSYVKTRRYVLDGSGAVMTSYTIVMNFGVQIRIVAKGDAVALDMCNIETMIRERGIYDVRSLDAS